MEEEKLDKLAIAEWDKRFDQIKEAFAEKEEVFQELYLVTNGYRSSNRMKKAFKIIEKASEKVNGTRNPARKLIRLFIYEAALRMHDYWKANNLLLESQARQYLKDYNFKEKHLPDLLDENFFKDALHAITHGKYK